MRNGVIGSTADSDSVSRGSSPFSVVPWQGRWTRKRPISFFECDMNYVGVWLSLVERYVRDVEVARSNRVTPRQGEKRITGCGSVWLERLVWDQEVAGSNPVTPILRV